MQNHPRALLALALACAVGAWTGAASAQDTAEGAPANVGDTASAPSAAAPADLGPTGMLRLGKLYSFGGGNGLEHGFGLDARYQLFPASGLDGYIGLFGQGQYELGDAWRFAGGITAGWGLLGFEVGVAHRTATSVFAGSTGLHIGQSLSFGPVTLGGRLTIPLVDYIPQNVVAAPAVQGFEAALTISMGFGFRVHGERRQASRGHGGHCHSRMRH